MVWIVLIFALVPVLCLVSVRRDRTLENQILTVLLRHGEMYGLQIMEAVGQDFGKEPGFGSLYPTLRRLEREGFVTARWGEEHPEDRGGARRRYYQRTGKRFRLEDRQVSKYSRPDNKLADGGLVR